jgi:hypothetical protein
MNKQKNTDTERYRNNFSLEFMADVVTQDIDRDNDPLNYVGRDCGINVPRVYQRWTDYWIHQAAVLNHV